MHTPRSRTTGRAGGPRPGRDASPKGAVDYQRMKRRLGLLGRRQGSDADIQRRIREGIEAAAATATAVAVAPDGGIAPEAPTPEAPTPEAPPAETLAREALARDVDELVELLASLTPKKQIAILDAWSGPQVTLADDVVVTVRSKKERRRFLKAVEDEVVDWFRTFTAGDVFYDVGANCGSLTLAAGGMHRGNISIVAIEPGYANFESLTRNLSGNDMLGFVTPLQIALMDRTGLEPINYYRSTSAGTSLHHVGRAVDHEDNEFTPVETQMIAAYTLDDVIDVLGLPAPTRVKIDVDGVEQALLHGAARTLDSGVIEDLLVEIVDHDRAGTRLSAIRGFLDDHGYEMVETFSHNVGDNKSFVADHLFRRRDRPIQTAPSVTERSTSTGGRIRDTT